MNKINYNPDVLDCLSNLSNDEVFTSPELANKIIDLLPQELFSNKEAKFLDPFCKSGVFLREIAKRLNKGLEKEIPNLQQRLDHIFHNQLFGIAITELTSLLSRRSLYCSKYPNFKYSISKFNSIEGNVRFRKINHIWKDKKCKFCGASKDEFDRDDSFESHAYEFIHTNKPEEIFNMKFDVIIGNPPYQLNDGGAQASSTPIYQLFIESAIKLNPKYITMIVPSRWFTGGKGLDDFREKMLKDRRLRTIHDFPNASDCFNGVEIKGGVNYFLWDKDNESDCEIFTHRGDSVISMKKRPLLEKNCKVFIRNNEMISIFHKVNDLNEKKFNSIVSSRKPYGLAGDVFKDNKKYNLPSFSDTPIKNGIKIYGIDSNSHRTERFASINYPLPKKDFLGGFKLFMPRNQGSGFFGEQLSIPIFAKPNECCTETFIIIGPFENENEMNNCYSYIKTKFFRALLSIKKSDQGAAQGVYEYIPLQDFSKKWSDEMLYKKYKLDDSEINFIEQNVKEML